MYISLQTIERFWHSWRNETTSTEQYPEELVRWREDEKAGSAWRRGGVALMTSGHFPITETEIPDRACKSSSHSVCHAVQASHVGCCL